MENIQNLIIVIIFIAFTFTNYATAQETASAEFEVHRVYPYIVITQAELKEANTLADIDVNYKESWFRRFISVDVTTINNGKTIKTSSKTDLLTQAQKNRMNNADFGSEISVKVVYIPENNLSHNDPKELNFSFIVEPNKQAVFSGGKEEMMQYLKINALDKISKDSFVGYDLSMIKFTVNEQGEIVDASVFNAPYQTLSDEVNNMLLKTVENMPCWEPAEYSNGERVAQDFVLNVGSMENCAIYTLKTWKDSLDEATIR